MQKSVQLPTNCSYAISMHGQCWQHAFTIDPLIQYYPVSKNPMQFPKFA